MIKNLKPRLPEIGKIKIGKLGQERKSRQGTKYRQPEKLDHFIITFPERGSDGNFIPDIDLMGKIADATGQDVGALTKLPCFLLYNDVDSNLYTSYCCYKGRTKVCQGDGKQAITSTGEVRPCPCEKLDRGYKGPAICKPYCRLSVVLAGVERIGGVWVYRSCGWNTVQDLMGSLALMYQITRGHLAGVPLSLNLVARTAVTPTGQTQKIYTVFLSYEGNLQSLASQQSVLPSPEPSPIPIETGIAPEEEEEIAEEFYPPEPEDTGAKAITDQPEPQGEGPSAVELAQQAEEKEKPKKTSPKPKRGKLVSSQKAPPEQKTEQTKSEKPKKPSTEPKPEPAPEPETPPEPPEESEGYAEGEIPDDFGWV